MARYAGAPAGLQSSVQAMNGAERQRQERGRTLPPRRVVLWGGSAEARCTGNGSNEQRQA